MSGLSERQLIPGTKVENIVQVNDRKSQDYTSLHKGRPSSTATASRTVYLAVVICYFLSKLTADSTPISL